MMMKGPVWFVARKYAQAFLALYAHALRLEDVARLDELQLFLVDHSEILFLCKLPHIPAEKKIVVLQQLLERFSLPKELNKLIALLVKDRRGWMLRDVMKHLGQLYAQQAHGTLFAITSSHPLSKAACDKIQGFLARATGGDIIYTYAVDPSLIAGIRLQSDTTLWEYSVNKQLRQLRSFSTK